MFGAMFGVGCRDQNQIVSAVAGGPSAEGCTEFDKREERALYTQGWKWGGETHWPVHTIGENRLTDRFAIL